jgi:hypothetical protein
MSYQRQSLEKYLTGKEFLQAPEFGKRITLRKEVLIAPEFGKVSLLERSPTTARVCKSI